MTYSSGPEWSKIVQFGTQHSMSFFFSGSLIQINSGECETAQENQKLSLHLWLCKTLVPLMKHCKTLVPFTPRGTSLYDCRYLHSRGALWAEALYGRRAATVKQIASITQIALTIFTNSRVHFLSHQWTHSITSESHSLSSLFFIL